MSRCGRGAERGAETLEFLGVLPLLVLVALMVGQGIILVRQQAEADADARTLARQAVICHAGAVSLQQIDPAATGTAISLPAPSPYVGVAVRLRPQALLAAADLSAWGFPSPQAAVTMRHEPC